jgi:hypothetical protein
MNMGLRIAFAVIISLGWGFVPGAFAQEDKDFLQGLDEIRDPFQSQLPIVEVPVKVIPQDNIPPVPQVELPPQPVVQAAPVWSPKVVPPLAIPRGQDNTAIVIKGLVWNTKIPQAIVNDRVIRVGDHVDGMKVISIHKKGVEFSNNGIKVFVDVSKEKNADR